MGGLLKERYKYQMSDLEIKESLLDYNFGSALVVKGGAVGANFKYPSLLRNNKKHPMGVFLKER